MKKVAIQDLKPGLVKGVEVQLPTDKVGYRETYFEWTPSSLTAKFKTVEVCGGVLRAWHHTPVFHEIETHVDAEMFYFLSGVALMLFVDVKAGCPNMETAQIVRVQSGTQLVIEAGKGHFVAVAESEDPVNMIVVSPQMDAPRKFLMEVLEGVIQ
jgi:oxalate decarboxylase/phosphoglucose isomerase-like protein (cupin superfamily)